MNQRNYLETYTDLIQTEFKQKTDSLSLIGINFFIDNFRAHLVTAYHKKIAKRLRKIRDDTIWIGGEDVSMAFKPLKMGLRVAHLAETWDSFEEKY